MCYTRRSTLHCALENGVDLYVNERQKIRHYRARSSEEEERMQIMIFYFARCVRAIIAMLYTHSVGNQP